MHWASCIAPFMRRASVKAARCDECLLHRYTKKQKTKIGLQVQFLVVQLHIAKLAFFSSPLDELTSVFLFWRLILSSTSVFVLENI